MKRQIIYAMGDVHADFASLNGFINKEIRNNPRMQHLAEKYELEVIVLQCGDFCFFWPNRDYGSVINNKVDFLNDGHVKIYWVDGNHEDHDQLDALQEQYPNSPFIEVKACVYFATFGSVLTLLDDTKVLFVGGAESEDGDKIHRVVRQSMSGNKSWWEQEGIDEKDMQALPHCPIDWVVSHAKPVGAELKGPTHHGEEPSQICLEHIFQKYNPTRWFHGHYHLFEDDMYDQCHIMCLDESKGGGRWYKQVADITNDTHKDIGTLEQPKFKYGQKVQFKFPDMELKQGIVLVVDVYTYLPDGIYYDVRVPEEKRLYKHIQEQYIQAVDDELD